MLAELYDNNEEVIGFVQVKGIGIFQITVYDEVIVTRYSSYLDVLYRLLAEAAKLPNATIVVNMEEYRERINERVQ